MRSGSRRHFPEWRGPFSNGFALAGVSRFASRSTEMYLLVVSTLTWHVGHRLVADSVPEVAQGPDYASVSRRAIFPGEAIDINARAKGN